VNLKISSAAKPATAPLMAARTARSWGPKAPVGSKAYANPPAKTPSAGRS